MSDDPTYVHVASGSDPEWTLCGIPTFPPEDGVDLPEGTLPFCPVCRQIALAKMDDQ